MSESSLLNHDPVSYEFIVVWETWYKDEPRPVYQTRKGYLIESEEYNIIKLTNPPVSLEAWNKINVGSVTAFTESNESIHPVVIERDDTINKLSP